MLYAAAEKFVGSQAAAELMQQVASKYGDCRVASALSQGDNYYVTLTTMNEAGWLEMTAVALSDAGN
jgi:hypothetical protein